MLTASVLILFVWLFYIMIFTGNYTELLHIEGKDSEIEEVSPVTALTTPFFNKLNLSLKGTPGLHTPLEMSKVLHVYLYLKNILD